MSIETRPGSYQVGFARVSTLEQDESLQLDWASVARRSTRPSSTTPRTRPLGRPSTTPGPHPRSASSLI
jgi:hypothetical protein